MTQGWKEGRTHSDATCYLAGAIRLGIDPSEYRAKREAGLRWCCICREWQAEDLFPYQANRRDKKATFCIEGGRARSRINMARLRAR